MMADDHPASGLSRSALAGLVEWLDETEAPSTHAIIGQEAPAAGYSSTTALVDITRADGTEPDTGAESHAERLVVKLAPTGAAIFDRYDFAMQAALQNAAAESGIPTAVPARAENDPRWTGGPFMVMPAIDGDIFREVPALDSRLAKADPASNREFHGRFVDLVSGINRIDWDSLGLADIVPRRDNTAELEYWRGYLDWYGDGERIVPALDDALAWCAANRPSDDPPASLLWGDVRIENVIVDPERRPLAVLDWEMACIGAAEHDLAWMLVLDMTQEVLVGRTVPGFLDHDACVARHEAHLGRRVQDLEWYEVFAMVRCTAIMSRIAYLNDRRGKANFFPIEQNPIVDQVTRRVGEASSTR